MKIRETLKGQRTQFENLNEIVSQHGNTRPHTCFLTRNNLMELVWVLMSNPPYISALAAPAYHMFQCL